MPTENRSSNTEMVSDGEMTECQFHNNCGGWCETRRELEHNLCEHCLESHDEEMSEPVKAPQPQPETAIPYGWHVEWSDSGDHHLFTKVEKRIEALRLDSDFKVVQLYARADTGEVERLRNATAFVQRLVDCAGIQQSVATGYLRDILDVLKGNPVPSAPAERDVLTAMVDAAMVEMANIHPPLKRSECERLIRAALERKQ